jgi:hypothetical protein
MENHQYKFGTLFWRMAASQMVSYMIMGIIATNMLNYKEIFDSSETYRAYDSPWIVAGPSLQMIRGLIFALALWPFKDKFLFQKNGWLKLWGLIVGLSVLSTTAAAPGSVEGFIYTTIPVMDQIKGYLEVVPQTGMFAFFVCYWYAHPRKAWNVLSIILVCLVIFMSIMGVLAASGIVTVT